MPRKATVKVSGDYKRIKSAFVRVAGTYKRVTQAWVKVAGAYVPILGPYKEWEVFGPLGISSPAAERVQMFKKSRDEVIIVTRSVDNSADIQILLHQLNTGDTYLMHNNGATPKALTSRNATGCSITAVDHMFWTQTNPARIGRYFSDTDIAVWGINPGLTGGISWTKLCMAATADGLFVYVFASLGILSSVRKYNVAANTWSTVVHPTGNGFYAAALMADGNILLLGKQSAGTARYWILDPDTDTFTLGNLTTENEVIDTALSLVYLQESQKTMAVSAGRLDTSFGFPLELPPALWWYNPAVGKLQKQAPTTIPYVSVGAETTPLDVGASVVDDSITAMLGFDSAYSSTAWADRIHQYYGEGE